MPLVKTSAAPSRPDGSAWMPRLVCFLILTAAICGYSLWVGPVAFMGDGYLFTDRAKHLYQLGNLDLNNHGSLIYPPLYSMVLAPLYALGEPGRILTAITVLNSLLIASALFPVDRLVTQYAGLTGRARWFFTLLIAGSATFVAYAPMVLSEALFIPLVYWSAYAVYRSLTCLSPRWFLITGLLFAQGLLIRSAATGLLLGGCGAWLLGLCLVQRIKLGRAAALMGIGLGAFALPMIAWHLFEKYHVTYQGGTEYSISTALRELLASRADQLIKLHWTMNGLLYFLLAPLNLGGLLILTALGHRPSVAWRDPLLPFVAAVMTLAIASIVILAPTQYGGNPLTWNKYFAPFVGLVTVIALRLRPLFGQAETLSAAAVAFILPWLGEPSAMVCHFPDSLSAFMNSARPLALSPWARDLLFVALLTGTAPLFLPSARTGWRVLAAVVAAGLGLLAVTNSALYWRASGSLNFSGHQGLAVKLQEAQRAEPGLPVFYDPGILRSESGEALRFLFYTPKLVPELPPSSLFLDGTHLPQRFLYASGRILPSARLLAKEGETLRLYIVDGSQVRHDLAYSIKYGHDVGGQETITLDGQPVPVRWLGPEPEILIQVDQPVASAQVGLRLSVGDHPRHVQATLNGEALAPRQAVTRIAWTDGFDYLVWRVPLRAGENRLTLKNDSEPVTLPDGKRRVTFLLIDEPVVSQPDPANP